MRLSRAGTGRVPTSHLGARTLSHKGRPLTRIALRQRGTGSHRLDGARGLASQALRAFLAIESTRPLYGRVAGHNVASAKVLARAGFVEVGSERSFAQGVGTEVVEHVYRLDR